MLTIMLDLLIVLYRHGGDWQSNIRINGQKKTFTMWEPRLPTVISALRRLQR